MIVSIIVFIVVLGGLVIIHELGHYGLARLFKVGVEEFGIGFPPRLYGIKRKQTIYSINWIPLGGFVKIKGIVGGDQMDTSGQTAESVTSDHFNSHAMWQRFLILFGGIFMNLLLAASIFSMGYYIGFPSGLANLPNNANVTQRAVVIVNSDKANLLVGDEIITINGQTIQSVSDMQLLLNNSAAVDAVVLLKREAKDIQVTIPIITLDAAGKHGFGVAVTDTGIVSMPFFTAIKYGVGQTLALTKQILQALSGMVASLFTRSPQIGEVAGPLGIAALTNQATQLGLVYVLQFAAMLSLNLAIFNLLPIPALDGGRIIFLLYELIARKPANQKIEAAVHNIGFLLLLILIILVTIKDIVKIF
ncbi:MAG: M50 family metallopeptidase [Patescibacteria group bacterium]|jgi:regulator of sigma E protease